MNEVIKQLLGKAAQNLGISEPTINLEHPEDMAYGDFSSNVAMLYAKQLKQSPKVLAEKIVEEINKDLPKEIEKVEVAGPGFINFKISDKYFAEEIVEISGNEEKLKNYGKNEVDKGKKIMVEYTDPNPFKEFHIGHLMSNAIGESISRAIEFSGAKLLRANWQGDVGPHVAKAVWGAMKIGDNSWGKAYTYGAKLYEEEENAKKEIDEINKKVYTREDENINKIYDKGRKESLEAFEVIYDKLGTKFDNYFFESLEGRNGEKVIQKYLDKGIFEKSEGAIIFPGEKYGLHNRVFITSKGLPTYEAKEIGLNVEKFKIYPDLSESIIITANEQNDYFKVLLKVFSLIRKDISDKTRHIGHGMMRLSNGKMGSRKGNVVTAENLLSEFADLVEEKIKDREFPLEEKNKLKEEVAIAAVKYTVLRQAIGGNVIYDPNKAVSFEGDSGPYLQYSAVRARSILTKAAFHSDNKKIETFPEKVNSLEKLLVRFPEVIERARIEYAPHHIVTYLIELAATFNSYYANNKIISDSDPLSAYRVALTKVFAQTMQNGLWVLGITVPERM